MVSVIFYIFAYLYRENCHHDYYIIIMLANYEFVFKVIIIMSALVKQHLDFGATEKSKEQ